MYLSFRGIRDLTENFEKRRFACAIAPDYTHDLAGLDIEGNVLEGPEVVGSRRMESGGRLAGF
jgi:hypothetical protein